MTTILRNGRTPTGASVDVVIDDGVITTIVDAATAVAALAYELLHLWSPFCQAMLLGQVTDRPPSCVIDSSTGATRGGVKCRVVFAVRCTTW